MATNWLTQPQSRGPVNSATDPDDRSEVGNVYDDRGEPRPDPYVSDNGGTTRGFPSLEAADFATTTKLPGWSSDFIKNVSGKYGDDMWSKYDKSVNRTINDTKWNIEQGRKAGESQFLGDIGRDTAEAARTLAATQAATGTRDSSVGVDQIRSLTQQVFGRAMEQQVANTGAAESAYQNDVDAAAAAQAFAGMVGDYLSKTQESYSAAFAGMTLEPGSKDQEWIDQYFGSNPDGSGGWDPVNGLEDGATYGEERKPGHWTVPNGWHKNGPNGPNSAEYEFQGQTFTYNQLTGEVTGIVGTTTAGMVDAKDLAGTAGLEGFAQDKIKEIVDKYGTVGMDRASWRTNELSAYDAGAAGDKLNQQYGGLSGQTMALLKSALGTAGFSAPSRGHYRQGRIGETAAGDTYGAERLSAIEEARQLSRNAIYSSNQRWSAGMKGKNAVDSANAQAGLAGQYGGLLGLTRNSYKPDVESYLSLAALNQKQPQSA